MSATGNNLTFSGDMTRRALRCSLDPGVERPGLRTFARDPTAIALANRGTYLAAAVTILRAYHVAGRPDRRRRSVPSPRWVRDALIWLGEADPCVTMDAVRMADPRVEALTMVTEQWQAVLGFRRVSVKEIIDTAVEQRATGQFGRAEFVHPELREALLLVAGDGGAISGRRLGKWIAANQNRIVGGLKLVAAGTFSGIARWRLDDSEDSRRGAAVLPVTAAAR